MITHLKQNKTNKVYGREHTIIITGISMFVVQKKKQQNI